MSTETKHWHLFARDVLAQIAYLCDIPATKAKDRADEYLAGILRDIGDRSGPEKEASRRALAAEAELSAAKQEIARLQAELSTAQQVIEWLKDWSRIETNTRKHWEGKAKSLDKQHRAERTARKKAEEERDSLRMKVNSRIAIEEISGAVFDALDAVKEQREIYRAWIWEGLEYCQKAKLYFTGWGANERALVAALAAQKEENYQLRKQIHPNDMGAGSLKPIIPSWAREPEATE